MSDYRNYRINSITIPEIDDNEEPTGINLTLEVVSQETLTRTIPIAEGGSYQNQEVVFVCFVNMPDRPKKLLIINPTEFDEIIVKTYQHENQKFRNSSSPIRKESITGRGNLHTGYSNSIKQNP
jgi:hypothetical protein